MSKLIKLAVLGVLVYGVYIAFLRPDWYEFTDPDGGYSVHFPEQPEHQSGRAAVPDMSPMTVNIYTYGDGKSLFITGSYKARWLSASSADPDKLFNVAGKTLADKLGAVVLDKKPVKRGGHTGVETRMTLGGGQLVLDVQWFFVGDRLYLVGAGVGIWDSLTAGRSRFFNSFEFL